MATLYTNNAVTTLNGAINDTTTTIVVTDGSVFPNPTGGDYFWLTLTDDTNIEIVKVTARSANSLTVVRGQDGTSGTAFADGDKAQLRITAAGLGEFAQAADYLPLAGGTLTGTLTGTTAVFDLYDLSVSSASTVETVVSLANTGGGAGNGIAIDLETGGTSQNVAARINSLDDGAYGYHLILSTKQTGSEAGALTERVRISSSGNVGIGTSSLNSKLVVDNGGSAAPATSGDMTTGQIIQAGPGSAAINIGANASGSSYTWINSGFANNAGVAAEFRIYSGGSQAITLDSSGNVGIGTTSPGSLLDVSGDIAGGNFIARSGVTALTYGMPSGTDGMQVFSSSNHVQFNTNSAERVRIDSSGNVGIGTTSPGAALDVVGAVIASDDGADDFAKLLNSGTTSALELGNTESTGGTFRLEYARATGVTQFYTGNAHATSVMAFDASGNVGIGTASPAHKLSVFSDNDAARTEIGIDNIDQRLVFGAYYETAVGQYATIQSTNNAETTAQLLRLQPDGGNVVWGTPGLHQLVSNGDIQARDIRVDRGDGTGVLYLADSGSRYLYYNGSAYYLNGADLYAGTANTVVLTAGNTPTYQAALSVVGGSNASATNASISSLNDIVQSGFHQATGASTHDGPTSADWHWVIHHEHTGLNGYGFQLANPINTGKLYIRNQNANIWGSWSEVYTDNTTTIGPTANAGLSIRTNNTTRLSIDNGGQIRSASGGTVANPAYSFSSYTDCGMGSSASTNVYLSIGNAYSLHRQNGSTYETLHIAEAGNDIALYFGDTADAVRGGFIFDTSASVLNIQRYNNSTAIAIDSAATTIYGDVTFGTSSTEAQVTFHLDSSHAVRFFESGVQVGDFACLDTTWFRINQNTNKNIYTPRYIRADNGFFVDGAVMGITADGYFRPASGSSSAPGVASVNDTDTGIFWSAANHIQFTTGGTQRGYWNSTSLYAQEVTLTSDIRVKTDIKDNPYGLDAVMRMETHRYKRTDSGRTEIGVIAQELEKIVPELVMDGSEASDLKSVTYPKMAAVFIKAIQELKKELDEVKRGCNCTCNSN